MKRAGYYIASSSRIERFANQLNDKQKKKEKKEKQKWYNQPTITNSIVFVFSPSSLHYRNRRSFDFFFFLLISTPILWYSRFNKKYILDKNTYWIFIEITYRYDSYPPRSCSWSWSKNAKESFRSVSICILDSIGMMSERNAKWFSLPCLYIRCFASNVERGRVVWTTLLRDLSERDFDLHN